MNYRIVRQVNDTPAIRQGKYPKSDVKRQLLLEAEWLSECNHGVYFEDKDGNYYVSFLDPESNKGSVIKLWAELIND